MIRTSNYFRNEPDNSVVIIFVHGVTGDSISTWTNANGAYWPDLLKNDPAFDKANIYLFDYSSPVMGTAYSINELAECMRRDLQSDKVLNHSKLIFLAHSMGGLVTREFLLKYKNYADKVSTGGFLYFFATPTSGSPLARIAKLFSQNPQFGKMVPLKSDNSLADIQRNWLASEEMRRIPSYGAYETKDTFELRIVEQESASHLCNHPISPIGKNHIDIVKSLDIKDESYRAFKAAFFQSAEESIPTLPSEKLVDELIIRNQSSGDKATGDLLSRVKDRILLAQIPPNGNVHATRNKKNQPLIKFTHHEFLDNFVAFYAYLQCRNTPEALKPNMLIELLNIYFRSVLLYPLNSINKYYVTAPNGALMLLQIQGHNQKGEKVSISLPDISASLLENICTNFVKTANPKQYEELEDLFNRAINTPDLDKTHISNIYDAQNFIKKVLLFRT